MFTSITYDCRWLTDGGGNKSVDMNGRMPFVFVLIVLSVNSAIVQTLQAVGNVHR